MNIHCTKSLLGLLQAAGVPCESEEPSASEDPLYSWHAKTIQLNSETALVFVNDLTRYTVMVCYIQPDNLKRLTGHFNASLLDCLKSEGFSSWAVSQYLGKAGAMRYSKTKNRSLVAHLNRASTNIGFHTRLFKADMRIQEALMRKVNSEPARFGDGESMPPKVAMLNAFNGLFGAEKTMLCHAVELRIRLDLFKSVVWREIVVPLHYTFYELHTVIQTVFDWTGVNLHDFYVFDGDAIIAKIISAQSAAVYEDGVETILEGDAILRDYLPRYEIVYRYDFREDWTHMIEPYGVILNYDTVNAVCTAGFGHRPPEAFDFELEGTEQYIRIMLDAGEPIGAGINLEAINSRLKYDRNTH